ncbi:MAG TPA: aspartate 1-decarboxylase [Spirochaetia bacterium]|nr:aspartate 1-decarboxylase [Spirochaetia bacterium]
MLLNMMRAKIHRATVTGAELHYVGSITIDKDLLAAAGILANERVQVVNLNNGERLETYAIEGPGGSGTICLNGAAARLAQRGDLVIIIAYGYCTPEEARNLVPKVVMVDHNNSLMDVREGESPGPA